MSEALQTAALDGEGPSGERKSANSTSFRELMGQYATGVCVVAVPGGTPDASAGSAVLDHEDGPSGMTVNSLVSISLEPMLICWAIQNTSTQFELYTGALDFTVSILAEDQHRLARRYAARGNSERDLADFALSEGGLPVIAGALGYLECRRWSLYPAGDHTLIFGEVVGIERARKAGPLGFFGGEFCRVAP